jgi:hypothetical protein
MLNQILGIAIIVTVTLRLDEEAKLAATRTGEWDVVCLRIVLIMFGAFLILSDNWN